MPTSVADQSGRNLKIVNWTAEAWVQIQNLHATWRWMRKTFSGTTTSGTSTYSDSSFSISNFRDWMRDSLITGYHPHTIYLTATGVSDERPLYEISWQEWRTAYGRGTQTNAYPVYYAITPDRQFALGPIPNDTYTVNGENWQSAILLAANGDTPGLPEAYEQIIVYKALMMLHEDGEHVVGIATARQNYRALLEALERDQLPIIATGGGPLA